MNLSHTNGTALLKNLVVSLLCVFINYINGAQIHTFRKQQVSTGSRWRSGSEVKLRVKIRGFVTG